MEEVVIKCRVSRDGMDMAMRGVTIVEILVGIGIVGLLAAIILPAVQSSRSASRRLHCASNERQLVLAMANYHESFGGFPPLDSWPTSGGCPPETVITRLFPFVDLPAICTILQSDTRRLPLLECPADEYIEVVPTPLSYVVNTSPGVGAGSLFKGPFEEFAFLSARDITDGLSNTAALSENIGVLGGGASAVAAKIPVRYWWSVVLEQMPPSALQNPANPDSLAARAVQTDLSIEDCNQGPRTFQPLPLPDAGQWGVGAFAFGSRAYSHWYPPNSNSCMGLGAPFSDAQVFLTNNRRAASSHSNGINVCFLDGHVRFVNNDVSQAIWRAAGTRNGGEATGESQ